MQRRKVSITQILILNVVLVLIIFIPIHDSSYYWSSGNQNGSSLEEQISDLEQVTEITTRGTIHNYMVNGFNNFLNFSDFLTQYNIANETEKPNIINNYLEWQETTGGGFPAIQNDTNVVFIYYNSTLTINSCTLVGDFTAWNEISMTRLAEGVNFFYREYSFEPTSRIDYVFVINGVEQVDPRNPNQAPLDFGYSSSELAMPKFVQPTEILYRSDIPHGTVATLQPPWENPKVQVYLPPNYDPKKTYPTLYTGDGSYYITLMSVVNILDNLIADQRIEPIIAVFIDPIDFDPLSNDTQTTYARILWYKCNPEYLTFLDKLVKYIDETYATNHSSYARAHLGFSISGLASAYVVIERPETFKLMACQSGSFRVGEEFGIMEKYSNAPASLDLKTWFSIGTYENNNNFNVPMVEYTQSMAAICSEKWPTEVVYIHECHSFGAWRHVLDDMLEFFFPYQIDPSTTASAETSMPIIISLIVFPLMAIVLLYFRKKS
ncbi:MAG: alpha/beta hydrolase-fold protein [Candidatus Hermodarchaeota archaeon]